MPTATTSFDISTGEGLLNATISRFGEGNGNSIPSQPDARFVEDFFCGRCAATRRHYVCLLAAPYPAYIEGQVKLRHVDRKKLLPMIFMYICQQCDARNAATLLIGLNNSLLLSIVPEDPGGIRTPNTPPAVGYYLDEARRSELGRARSATATMYRSALEHLLFEQGYQKGMLNEQILALEAASKAETCPTWAKDADSDLMHLLRRIGNGSIHKNDGDIAKQKVIDEELLRVIGDLMAALLDAVYEEPKRAQARKNRLALAATGLDGKA